MTQERVALLGFGDIAHRLSVHLPEHRVFGVKRTPLLQDAPIPIMTYDCRDQRDMNTLMKQKFDVIVMTFTPTDRSDAGYQKGYVDTLKTVLTALDHHCQHHVPRLLVWVSSSSVYHQRDGSWVDEDTVTQPVHYSGRRLLEAEQLVARSRYPSCCVRFSGIYGPGRQRLLDQVRQGRGGPQQPVQYSNRIHADDCAGVLAHLITQSTTTRLDPLYLATDCQPAPLYDVKQWLATQLHLPDNHLRVCHQPRINPSVDYRSSNKRCSNQKLLDSGYRFLYPTFREGYASLIRSYRMDMLY